MWTVLGQQLPEDFTLFSKGDCVALALNPVPSKCLGIYVPDRVIQTAFPKVLTSLTTCKPTPTPSAMSVLLSIDLSVEQISI